MPSLISNLSLSFVNNKGGLGGKGTNDEEKTSQSRGLGLPINPLPKNLTTRLPSFLTGLSKTNSNLTIVGNGNGRDSDPPFIWATSNPPPPHNPQHQQQQPTTTTTTAPEIFVTPPRISNSSRKSHQTQTSIQSSQRSTKSIQKSSHTLSFPSTKPGFTPTTTTQTTTSHPPTSSSSPPTHHHHHHLLHPKSLLSHHHLSNYNHHYPLIMIVFILLSLSNSIVQIGLKSQTEKFDIKSLEGVNEVLETGLGRVKVESGGGGGGGQFQGSESGGGSSISSTISISTNEDPSSFSSPFSSFSSPFSSFSSSGSPSSSSIASGPFQSANIINPNPNPNPNPNSNNPVISSTASVPEITSGIGSGSGSGKGTLKEDDDDDKEEKEEEDEDEGDKDDDEDKEEEDVKDEDDKEEEEEEDDDHEAKPSSPSPSPIPSVAAVGTPQIQPQPQPQVKPQVQVHTHEKLKHRRLVRNKNRNRNRNRDGDGDGEVNLKRDDDDDDDKDKDDKKDDDEKKKDKDEKDDDEKDDGSSSSSGGVGSGGQSSSSSSSGSAAAAGSGSAGSAGSGGGGNGGTQALVPISKECNDALIKPKNKLARSQRTDITFIVFQAWLFVITLIGIIYESIPHIATVIITHFLALIFSIVNLIDTQQFHKEFHQNVVFDQCMGLEIILPNYWETVIGFEIGVAVTEGIMFLVLSIVAWKLCKLLKWRTWKRIGASRELSSAHKAVMSFKICLLLAVFFVVAFQALWLNELINTWSFTEKVNSDMLSMGYKVFLGLLTGFVPFWLGIGWWSVGKLGIGKIRCMFVFVGFDLALLGNGGFLLSQKTFMTYDWDFLTFMGIVAAILTILTLLLAIYSITFVRKGISIESSEFQDDQNNRRGSLDIDDDDDDRSFTSSMDDDLEKNNNKLEFAFPGSDAVAPFPIVVNMQQQQQDSIFRRPQPPIPSVSRQSSLNRSNSLARSDSSSSFSSSKYLARVAPPKFEEVEAQLERERETKMRQGNLKATLSTIRESGGSFQSSLSSSPTLSRGGSLTRQGSLPPRVRQVAPPAQSQSQSQPQSSSRKMSTLTRESLARSTMGQNIPSDHSAASVIAEHGSEINPSRNPSTAGVTSRRQSSITQHTTNTNTNTNNTISPSVTDARTDSTPSWGNRTTLMSQKTYSVFSDSSWGNVDGMSRVTSPMTSTTTRTSGPPPPLPFVLQPAPPGRKASRNGGQGGSGGGGRTINQQQRSSQPPRVSIPPQLPPLAAMTVVMEENENPIKSNNNNPRLTLGDAGDQKIDWRF